MDWTDDADRLLVSLWQAGGTLNSVRDDMLEAGYNVTRNSIVGRKNRLKLMGVDIQVRPRAVQPRRIAQMQQQRQQRALPPTPPPTLLAFPVAPVADHDDGVDYLENGPDGCKALLEKRGSYGLPMCCGKQRVYDFDGSRSSYCSLHHRLYRTNTQAGRRWA